MQLILVRHGTTALNAQRRFQGWSDASLDAQGEKQAAELARALYGHRLEAVVTSDLLRATATAEVLTRKLGMTFTTDARLRELCFGEWEGLTFDEIEARHPILARRWTENPWRHAPPAGETLHMLHKRITAFLAEMGRTWNGRTVGVVAHAGSLQVLMAAALEANPTRFWQYEIQPGSWSSLKLNQDGGVLEHLNVNPVQSVGNGNHMAPEETWSE